MDKHIREFERSLQRGKPPLKLAALVRTGKGHYKATVEDPITGRSTVYILANSPSDHRAARNALGHVRRFFNN